jgi:site-specific DNA-cytosine methylase
MLVFEACLAFVSAIACARCAAVIMATRLEWTEASIQHIPEPPDLEQFLRRVKFPKEKLRVSYPCAGIAGTAPIWRAAKMETHAVNVCDLEEGYEKLLKSILNASDEETHVGSIPGDVLKIPLNDITPSHILVVGPPCPPWAGQGNANSVDDARAMVFEQMLRWIMHMAFCGTLLVVTIENVPGIKMKLRGREAYIDVVLETLRKEVPAFVWDIVTLRLENYGIPHIRERVFVRGMRKTFGTVLPPPLPPLPRKPELREFLDMSLPHTPRSSLPYAKRQNLRDIEREVKVMLKTSNLLDGFPLVVTSIDRSIDKIFPQRICINLVPTLSTTNEWLHVQSTHDMEKNDEDREIFRLLHLVERLPLQGLSKSLASLLGDSRLILKATGNTYSPPLVAAALCPILDLIASNAEQKFTTMGKHPPCARVKSFKLRKLKVVKAVKGKSKAKPKPKTPQPKP